MDILYETPEFRLIRWNDQNWIQTRMDCGQSEWSLPHIASPTLQLLIDTVVELTKQPPGQESLQ